MMGDTKQSAYKDSIFLPNPKFQMRANLKDSEIHVQESWNQQDVYGKINRRTAKRYTLHDGPPYANGDIHMGHALNKILKDFVVKSRAMMGFAVNYIPGWDCHGLPIELNVEKSKKVKSTDLVEKIKAFREYAGSFVESQKKDFVRLGGIGDWENPYRTMDFSYEAEILRQFGKMVDEGLVFRGKKPVYWCIKTRTALAEAEIEYKDRTDPSVYVAFDVVETKVDAIKNGKFVIWTTTPWTLPANLGICLHPDLEYVLTSSGYIVAKDLLESFNRECSLSEEVRKSFKGSELEGSKAQHPFLNRTSLVILGDHVTTESGTGCVHTAPGHGMDDFIVGQKYQLEPLCPVDAAGRLTEEAGVFVGEKVFDANPKIVDLLKEKGALLAHRDYLHSYPHNWRTPSPLIFRATSQWFMTMDGKANVRKKCLNAIKNIEWIPGRGIERIRGMLESKPDWVLSRQRLWGIPIPAIVCGKCDHVELNAQIVEKVASRVEKEGIEVWQSMEPSELVGSACKKCGAQELLRDHSILDVWFDSGVSHSAVIAQRAKEQNINLPVDLYLEGSDQHRGWFQSSLITSIATTGKAPYKSVLTHGFVLDGKGKKMSKSLGNVIVPSEVIQKFGADILRLWVASENYTDDLRISQEIIKRSVESYRKVRNTLRFMLGVVQDFDPKQEAELLPIDHYILSVFEEYKEKVLKAYETCGFHQIYHLTNNFINVDMSSFYLDIIKDRIYCDYQSWNRRIAAQKVVHIILDSTMKLLAPILSHTMEEAWKSLGEDRESILLQEFPKANKEYLNFKDQAVFRELRSIRDLVLKKLEAQRVEKVIGHSLQAKIRLGLPQAIYQFVTQGSFEPQQFFIVSKVEVYLAEEIQVEASKASGEKCQRCWVYSDEVGKFQPEDVCGRCSRVLIEYEK